MILSIGVWQYIPSDLLHPRIPCKHSIMFLAIYIYILIKITFSINHINLSKTKDLHAWIVRYSFRFTSSLQVWFFLAIYMDRILKLKSPFVFFNESQQRPRNYICVYWCLTRYPFRFTWFSHSLQIIFFHFIWIG